MAYEEGGWDDRVSGCAPRSLLGKILRRGWPSDLCVIPGRGLRQSPVKRTSAGVATAKGRSSLHVLLQRLLGGSMDLACVAN